MLIVQHTVTVLPAGCATALCSKDSVPQPVLALIAIHLAWLCVRSLNCNAAMQEQDTAHRLSVLAHQLLLGLPMGSHTLLHKVVPKVVSEPLVMPMMMGTVPYRKLTAAMYQDALLFAVLLLVGIAGSLCLH